MEKERREEILGKIKKLMALGVKHENTHEGQSALDKAKALMAKHDIRFIDVEDDGTVQDANIGRVDVPWHKHMNDFESKLAHHIADTLDCSYVMVGKGRKGARHSMIGTKTDLDLAEWLFKFTRLQCYRLAEKHGYRGKELRTYFFGLYFVLRDKITDAFGEIESEVHSEEQCTALVLVKKDAVDKRKADEFPKLTKGRKMRPLTGTFDAYNNGQADGAKVSVNRQVANGNNNQQVGGM
jgi:hypothetical protein